MSTLAEEPREEKRGRGFIFLFFFLKFSGRSSSALPPSYKRKGLVVPAGCAPA